MSGAASLLFSCSFFDGELCVLMNWLRLFIRLCSCSSTRLISPPTSLSSFSALFLWRGRFTCLRSFFYIIGNFTSIWLRDSGCKSDILRLDIFSKSFTAMIGPSSASLALWCWSLLRFLKPPLLLLITTRGLILSLGTVWAESGGD